ncbi:MAG: aspartate-semialdehyde dehydrogenase [Chloroflexi bacterium]|nr:MAG: aspartate-semialdehyde dehydrogenase [Chloroflexota bacterium]
MPRIPVAILGATGAVGQRFVQLLADHPWFRIAALTGSERSAGRPYGTACRWVVPGEMPEAVRRMTVLPSTPEALTAAAPDVRLLFSALPSGVAREAEPALAAAGYAVCSNASAHRLDSDVPLLIPEVNADHLALIPHQQRRRGWPGFLVTSPNCSTTGIVLPLKPLHEAFEVRRVQVVTLQAVSGAGYPGVPSMEILDNVIPYIAGEEDKLEQEPRKLLGRVVEGRVEEAPITLSAQVHRVPVFDGHLAALSIEFATEPTPEAVAEVLRDYRPPSEVAALPSAPKRLLIVRQEPDRPQPRRDRDAEGGMAVTIGRIRRCPLFHIRLVSLVHNTLRGAAGGAILNAELLVQAGWVPSEHHSSGLGVTKMG